MNNITAKTVFFFIASVLAFSSCNKKSDTPSLQNNQAIMKMEVSCSGDIASQVAVLSFLAVDANGGLVNIANDSTGAISAGPFFQNSDFPPSKQISFHSASKAASVSVMLSIAPKIYATTPDQGFIMTSTPRIPMPRIRSPGCSWCAQRPSTTSGSYAKFSA